jgi:ubiquinone/menaquinone biosynthesis C-methylase UbiE
MSNVLRLLLLLALLTPSARALADTVDTTRVTAPDQHACTGSGGNHYREKCDYVLKELDLKPGDVVVDIGAGDGWWAEKMASCLGDSGVVHAGEVKQELVDKMTKKLTKAPQVKPYLCPTDGTGLSENSCDLAFFSKSYHHLNEDGHVDYLRHLKEVVKPTGRVCIIERHPSLSVGREVKHGWSPGLLMQQAAETGWVPVRYELITGTYHFMAVLVHKELFPLKKPEEKPADAKDKKQETKKEQP